jgi:hypothetical protein
MEERDTYQAAKTEPSPQTCVIISRVLARWMKTLQQTMPYHHLTEETLRQICQTALVMYEEESQE